MLYIKCDKPLFLPWREFLCFVLIISVRRASYAKGQRMIFNINIYTWLNSEGGKAKQLWTLLKGLRNPAETVFESICRENSIIIASYQVILIFDNVFFKKPPPQGSETFHKVRRPFYRVWRFSKGFMVALPSPPRTANSVGRREGWETYYSTFLNISTSFL